MEVPQPRTIGQVKKELEEVTRAREEFSRRAMSREEFFEGFASSERAKESKEYEEKSKLAVIEMKRLHKELASLEREEYLLKMRLWSNRVIINGVDATEHVAAMFDAIVNSLDWGSGFLCTEDIESIMIVANLMGFDPPEVDPTSAPEELIAGIDQAGMHDHDYRKKIRDAWAAQVKAKTAALLTNNEA